MGCSFACIVHQWHISLPIAALALLVYWYLTWNFNHWAQKGVKFIKPVPLFGSIKDRILFRRSFHDMQLLMYREFDGQQLGGYFEGRRPVLMLRDPELIRAVAVRDFEHFVDRPTLRFRDSPFVSNMLLNLKGPHWKTVRATMTPAFSSGKLRVLQDLVCQCGQQMEKFLVTNHIGGQSEMKEFFGRFTLDVIATCAFGVQCNSLLTPDAEFVRVAAHFNDIGLLDRILIFAVILVAPKMGRFLPVSFFNKKALAFLVEAVQNTKEHRKKNPKESKSDFLQIMIDAGKQDAAMTDEVIVAQSLLFLLAGYETSSTLLTFASYELALHPEIQERLRKEIQDVLENHGECSYEALQDMHYLEMVLLETLRKYPPVARVDRVCTRQYTVPNTGVTLDEGSVVSIPIIGLHYDPKHYTDPEYFNPDRFLPDKKAQRSPYVFLPFGVGPRNCIGTRFALMSSKTAMAYLLKDFKLSPCEKTEIPFTYSRYSMLLKAQNGIWLNIDKIN